MKYSTIKIKDTNQEVKVSKLGLGCMRFPKNDGIIDQDKVNEMVKYAYENGVNYFDTAYAYQGSEEALGKAIKQFNREDIFIADKLAFWSMESIEDRDRIFQKSLDRLQTEYIDFYLLHSLNKGLMPKVYNYDAVAFAKKLKEEGKIKYLGFSIHDDHDMLVEILDLADWDFVQIQYNYLDLNDAPGQKGYDELVSRNIPIVIMEPLKGGILSDLPESVAKPYIDLGGSNVSFAFRWLAQQKNVAVVLSGMSSLTQLKENIEIFSNLNPLTEEEEKAVVEVKDNIIKYQKVPCTGCGYCMPCPVGVQIPTTFKAWNMKAMPNSQNNWASGTVVNYENAAQCVDCNACVSHCPQRIDIPKKLKQCINEKE